MLGLILSLMLAAAQDDGLPRPQNLDTGFYYNITHRHHLEMESVTSAYGGLTDLLHVAMDDTVDDNRFCKIAKYGFSAWLDTIAMSTAHEYGHVSALSRAGFNVRTMLYVDGEKFGATNPAAVAWGSIIGRPSLLPNEDDWLKAQDKLGGKFDDWYTLVMAGGLNQEQIFVSRQVDRYLEGELSRLDSWIILWGNWSTITYGSDGDMYEFVRSAHTTQNAVKNYSLVRFLSGSSLKAMVSVLEGAAGVRSGYVKPMSLGNENVTVFWPEFQSFLTLSGPSVKSILTVKLCGILLMPSVEAAHGAEGGLRLVAPVTSFLRLNASIYHHSDGNWFDGSAEIRPWQWFGLFAGYEYGHGHTFHRDVYGATMDNTEHSVLAGANVHFTF